MKRIAHIVDGFIENVSIANDNFEETSLLILEENALSSGFVYKPKNNNPIKNGYVVNPEGFILGLEDEDRILFNQMISLIREALDLGLITNDTPQIITDINGKDISLTTLRFRQIMVGYGMYYKSLWDQMA